MAQDVQQYIKDLIANNSVVLFMKGTAERPQCGFSKRVVEVLQLLTNDFVDVDVLSDPALREGIKVFSSWPTIPQLYIDGEFIGGCDITLELFNSRKLPQLLKVAKADKKPQIEILPEAAAALKDALPEDAGECLRITITSSFEHGLSFDTKRDDDFLLEADGLRIVIDPYSASRAHGLSLDHITDEHGSGFYFNNPHVPPAVADLSVDELKTAHERGDDILLIDVRERDEWQKAHIPFAKLLIDMTKNEIAALKKDQAIAFHCHHGGRSKKIAESFRIKGFRRLYNLAGGIDAWSKKIDPSIPLY